MKMVVGFASHVNADRSIAAASNRAATEHSGVRSRRQREQAVDDRSLTCSGRGRRLRSYAALCNFCENIPSDEQLLQLMRYASRDVLSSPLVRDTVTDGTKHGCRNDRDHHGNRCLLRYDSTICVKCRDNNHVSLRSTMVQSRARDALAEGTCTRCGWGAALGSRAHWTIDIAFPTAGYGFFCPAPVGPTGSKRRTTRRGEGCSRVSRTS